MKGSRTRYNEEKLHHFVSALEASIICVNEEVARKYAITFDSN